MKNVRLSHRFPVVGAVVSTDTAVPALLLPAHPARSAHYRGAGRLQGRHQGRHQERLQH